MLNKKLESYYGNEIEIYGIGEHTKWLLSSIPINKFKKIYLID